MEPNTPLFENWTPSAILALFSAISLAVGGGISWLATKGIEKWIELRKFRLEEKERIAALPQPAKEKFSTEQVFEDTELATGYKLMLYQQDKRIRELESATMDWQSKWQKTNHDLVAAATKADMFERQLEAEKEECRKNIERLEKQIQSMYRQLQKRGLTNGEDPPTPPPGSRP